MIFPNRYDAGRQLAAKLAAYAGRTDVIVLALPRGGVPVGFEVAQALQVPLDVLLVRKLGLPGHEELAMGAIASGGVRVLNDRVVGMYHPSEDDLARITERETRELKRRELAYRNNRPLPEVGGKTVLLVDDGLATGSTMRAAVAAIRTLKPAHLVIAVPVCASDTCEAMQSLVDSMVCLSAPEPFYAVGQFYEDFSPTTDEEVVALLARSVVSNDP